MNTDFIENRTVLTALYTTLKNLNRQPSAAPLNRLVLACSSVSTQHLAGAIKDMEWFSSFVFPIEGNLPDPVEMKVTQIEASPFDPGSCHFTVQIDYTNSYTEKEILGTVKNHTSCQFTASRVDLGPFDNSQFMHLLEEVMPELETHLDPEKQRLITGYFR